MDILTKIIALFEANERIVITPEEYQSLCAWVSTLPVEEASELDDLILNYNYEGQKVIVDYGIEQL